MSALGQKRTLKCFRLTSALPRKQTSRNTMLLKVTPIVSAVDYWTAKSLELRDKVMRKDIQRPWKALSPNLKSGSRLNKSDCVSVKGLKPTGLKYELLLCFPHSKR